MLPNVSELLTWQTPWSQSVFFNLCRGAYVWSVVDVENLICSLLQIGDNKIILYPSLGCNLVLVTWTNINQPGSYWVRH